MLRMIFRSARCICAHAWKNAITFDFSDHAGDKLKNWSEAAAIISEQKSETEKGEIQNQQRQLAPLALKKLFSNL